MLVVTVELWPYGRVDERRVLTHMQIVNDGTGSTDVGNYAVTRIGHGNRFVEAGQRAVTHGKVRGHKRRQEAVWELVRDAIVAARSTSGEHP